MKTPQKTRDTTLAAKLRSFDAVHAAIVTHGGEAAVVLDGESRAVGRNVGYRPVFSDLGERLASAKRRMLAANSTHLGRLAVVAKLRERRDAVKKGLLADFTPARHTLENLYGSVRGFTVVGVAGSTLRDPKGLVKQVRDTVDFLEQPKVELSPAVEEVDVDLESMASRLAAGADRLDAVVTDYARAEKDAQTTRKAKNAAIETYDRTFLHVAQTTEGLFNLAGLPDLAQRVRPSIRRAGRREADEGSPDDTADEPAPETAPASTGA